MAEWIEALLKIGGTRMKKIGLARIRPIVSLLLALTLAAALPGGAAAQDTDGAQKILSVDMAAAGLDEAQTDVDEQAKADIHTGVQAILDAAELEPSVTGIDALDALVAETLAKITNEDMTTYEKVVACYDYLTDNMRYGSSMYHLNVPLGDTTCADIFYTYGEVDGFGAVALTSNYGLCNGYAAGFILLTRAIGLDADLVTGQTRSAGGGYAYHKWAEITIDGTAYAFDPQLDQSYAQKGLGEYSNFCKTYEQINGRYIKA